MIADKPESVDAYIQSFEPDVQEKLHMVRQAISDVSTQLSEAIAYGMPTLKYKGKNLIHYAAFKHHIGLYATPSGHASFADELSRYKGGKGSVQFPFTEPLPLDLIQRIVAFRISETDNKTTKP